uniref:Uncharacterized protein TCIL3000_11_11800 n=1 Tax=Trypanosoma congolense (strain IL3000) TaxID=1068625 RepID=G0V216_TRYCI|nr:unnamed protein product [Trypanosoma congolense IL3000]
MSGTNFDVGASVKGLQYLNGVEGVSYCGESELIAGVLSSVTSGTLVFAVVDKREDVVDFLKTLFTSFSDSWGNHSAAYTQFSVSFIDETMCELVQYRCDRPCDINNILEEDGLQYRCCSVSASLVEPTSDSFDILSITLSVVICCNDADDKDFIQTADMIAAAQGMKIGWIFVYFASENESHVKRCLTMAKSLRKAVSTHPIGASRKRDTETVLKQVRGWSLFTNEFYRLAPQSEGPYLINLNPCLVVGEKLAHAIARGISFMVADEANAGSADIVVFPLGTAENNSGNENVFSPHCSLKYEGDTVFIRPECGMTYINGNFLSTEVELRHNDRILLGNRLAFRFVVVPEKEKQEHTPRVIDWESSCKEFEMAAVNVAKSARLHQLEDEVMDLRDKCEKMEAELLAATTLQPNAAWLILSNPPSDHAGPCVWDLCWMVEGDSLTLGPDGDIPLQLGRSGSIERTGNGFTISCDSRTTEVTHLQPFTVGQGVFLLSLQSASVKRRGVPTANTVERCGADPLSALMDGPDDIKNTLYRLQWTIAQLLDFAFPEGASDRSLNAVSPLLRSQIVDYSIYTTEDFTLRGAAAQVKSMAAAVQIAGARMAQELHTGVRTSKPVLTTPRCQSATKQRPLTRTRSAKEVPKTERVNRFSDNRENDVSDVGVRTRKISQPNTAPVKEEHLYEHVFGGLGPHVLGIKAKCFIASPIAVRQMNVALQVLSFACDVKMQLKRYVRELDLLLERNYPVNELPDAKKQEMALALIDIFVALTLVMRNFHLTHEDKGVIESRVRQWSVVADVCIPVISNTELCKGRVDINNGPLVSQRRTQTPVKDNAIFTASGTATSSARRQQSHMTVSREPSRVVISTPTSRQESTTKMLSGPTRRQMLSGTPAATLKRPAVVGPSPNIVSKSLVSKHIPVSPRLGVQGRAGAGTSKLRHSISTHYHGSVGSPRNFPHTRDVHRDAVCPTSLRPATVRGSLNVLSTSKLRKL